MSDMLAVLIRGDKPLSQLKPIRKFHMSKIDMRRHWRALFIAACLVTPFAAQADNSMPLALRNLKVFESGTSTLPQLHLLKLNVKPRVGPATVFDKVTGNKYVITPHTPVIPGIIAFMFSSYPGGKLLVLPWGPLEYISMTGSDDPATAPWTGIVLNAAAGKSYLVDVNMFGVLPTGSTGSCAIDIAGPGGSDQKSSCATNDNSQDIAFIYKADKANIANFTITIQGSQASGTIFSATMAVLP
jgi:hypothetical protein